MRIFNWTREDGRPTREWCRDDTHGTHVPLPLDASAVPDAVVDVMIEALRNSSNKDPERYTMRRLIAALAQALGEDA